MIGSIRYRSFPNLWETLQPFRNSSSERLFSSPPAASGQIPVVFPIAPWQHSKKLALIPLTEQEYEHAYEALLCLDDDGHAVGRPLRLRRTSARGMVDGRKLNDKAVLEHWWGKAIAWKIMRGRTDR